MYDYNERIGSIRMLLVWGDRSNSQTGLICCILHFLEENFTEYMNVNRMWALIKGRFQTRIFC